MMWRARPVALVLVTMAAFAAETGRTAGEEVGLYGMADSHWAQTSS